MKISQIQALDLTSHHDEIVSILHTEGLMQPSEGQISARFDKYKADLITAENSMIFIQKKLYEELVCQVTTKPVLADDLDHSEIAAAIIHAENLESAELVRLRDIEVDKYHSVVLKRLQKPAIPTNLDFKSIPVFVADLREQDRKEDIRVRYEALKAEDAGIPAFHKLHPDKPNSALFFEKEIYQLSAIEAESVLFDVEVKNVEMQDAQEAIKYRELRRAEYPAISDQLDELVKAAASGDNSGWLTMVSKCMAVKAKFPKS